MLESTASSGGRVVRGCCPFAPQAEEREDGEEAGLDVGGTAERTTSP